MYNFPTYKNVFFHKFNFLIHNNVYHMYNFLAYNSVSLYKLAQDFPQTSTLDPAALGRGLHVVYEAPSKAQCLENKQKQNL